MEKKNKNILFALSGSKELGKRVAKCLKMPLSPVEIKHFADGETMVKSVEVIRNKNVYIIQSTSKPVNENLMELLIAIDSFKRASAKTITVLFPYYGYARQDRKSNGREPITCKLVADLVEEAGATRVAVIDIHSVQSQGFFDMPVDTCSASQIILSSIVKDAGIKNTVIVSPDYGSVKRVRDLSDVYGLPVAILDKRRPEPNKAEIANVLGDVKNKNVIIVDDMIDTGGTLLAASKVLKEKGAKKIFAGATHGLFSHDAIKNFNKAIAKKQIDKLYIGNSIDHVYKLGIKGLKVVDLAPLIAEILKVYLSEEARSMTQLYKKVTKKI
ncbi:MAG: ribose-phosphate pyrophosphokinase [Mycoplasmoidaceae bacterium]|nr:ribose-phosphate pyrophosphokinase [Mycoplasmoidaceae bacterium]